MFPHWFKFNLQNLTNHFFLSQNIYLKDKQLNAMFWSSIDMNKYGSILNAIVKTSINDILIQSHQTLMIKSIVEKVMIKEFSKYIHGIEYNKLTIEVLGGYFSIQNISLNHNFFNSLQTPFQIAYSHIGKLSIEAPLTKLSSVPVSCTIEDVYVIVAHKMSCTQINELSKEELLKKFIKQSFEVLITKMKQANKEAGMMDKLAKKVIDNLKMQIKNIHIRFEECNANNAYSFGVSLKSLNFCTTDMNWKPMFVQRQKQKVQGAIYKSMAIQNFKIYWQSIPNNKINECLFLRQENNAVKIDYMRKFVTNDNDSIFKINSQIKIKINPTSNFDSPLFEVDIDLEPININFTKQKIVEVLDFTTSCIKYNEVILKSLLEKALKKTSHQLEKKYKPICKKYVETILAQDKKKPEKGDEQTAQLFNIISIDTLYEWSMPVIKEKIQLQRQKQLKKEKKSWFSSEEVKLTADEKKQVERLLDQLAEDNSSKGRPLTSILLHTSFKSKGLFFTFFDESKENKLKTIELKIEQVFCQIQKSHNNSYFSVQTKIKQITADLKILEQQELHNIQLMENVSVSGQQQYLLQLFYRQNILVANKTVINKFTDLTLRKTVFTYKQQYWKMFNSFFSLPQINQQVQNQAIGKLQFLKKQSSDEQDNPTNQIQKHYNINMSLSSPSFILPLSSSTCWYLDLGKITMRSQAKNNKFIYPFKLSQLNMRYIDLKGVAVRTDRVIGNNQFFPIIKDINVDVDMITSLVDNNVKFNVVLDKIELSATKQQFISLMNVKKFIVGEEKDQLQMHSEQVKTKQQIIDKTRLQCKVRKRGKYLQSWLQYYCHFSNNNLYLYLTQKQLIPDSIISLRGAKVIKKITNQEFILEIIANNEANYLQFTSLQIANEWEAGLLKNINQLKDLHSLILDESEENGKSKRKKKEDLVSINMKLSQMSWNYLKENGQFFMKIELNDLNFQVLEKQQNIQTVFDIARITIIDKVFQYKNNKYQHLLKGQKLSLSIGKMKQKVTKISPIMIKISTESLDVNWKPDSILLILQSVKQLTDFGSKIYNKDKSKQQIVMNVVKDDELNLKINKYINEGSNNFIKNKRDQYLKMNVKDDQIYVKFQAEVSTLKVSFIHRQSHMPMFLLSSSALTTKISFGRSQKFIEGSLKTLQLFQISGYPQKQYDINTDYQPFCLLKKQVDSSSQILQFKYSSYEPQQITNSERVDSFLYLLFTPIRLCYIQQVIMRLIDYFQIQIILLLNHTDMMTANQDILQQLLSNSNLQKEKPKNFLQNQLQEVVKKLIYPFFMDYYFVFQQPEICLSPMKDYKHYLLANIKNITITNQQKQTSQRFQKIKYQFKNYMYEEHLTVAAEQIILNSINNKQITPLVFTPFDLNLIVNRLLFEDQINQITPQICNYDRSFKITNYITAINMPELSKFVYQNLVRLPNFNFNFQDNNGELFIHNYRITKILSPKPIHYQLKIKQIAATAQHSLDEFKNILYKLWSISIQGFQLQFHRDQKLNSFVEINLQSVNMKGFVYRQLGLNLQPHEKQLINISKSKQNKCFAIIKMPNTTKIDIQCCVQQCDIYMDFGILPLIADWVQVDDSVFPQAKQRDRLINFLLRMPSVKVYLQDQTVYHYLKMEGQLIISATRFDGFSQNYLMKQYQDNRISPTEIQKLKQFMTLKISLGFQFFSCFANKQRKLLQKMEIDVKELNFYKIRNDNFRKTMIRKANISGLKGNISIDDFILMKSIIDIKKKGENYEKSYRELIKSSFLKEEQDLEKSIYKDIVQQDKITQQFQFKIDSLKLYLIHKQNNQFLPILKISANNIELMQFINNNNQVFNGGLQIQICYFNDCIFRWQPVLQNSQIKLCMANNHTETNKLIQIQGTNKIYINFSSQMAVSVKKALRCVQNKLQEYNKGMYAPQQANEYVSRYVIRNETGYPIELFDQNNISQYVMMNQQQINYISKSLLASFFQDNQIKQTFAFNILHPTLEILPVSSISLDSHKSFQIQLYSTRGKELPEQYKLYIENQIDGWKKIMTIRSKKCIYDYSSNTLVKKYYPFDYKNTFQFTEGPHKGVKVSFYSKVKTERYIYSGFKGNLTIRKTYLVYNYTMIPLRVSDYVVIPGEFVGINQALTIQGVPYRQSFLKVIFNQMKHQYYIYSISYIIDYSGLNFIFEEDYPILKYYSTGFQQDGKNVRIYLLPDINFTFKVKINKNSTSQLLNGKLARQNFSLQIDSLTYAYSCYSYLQSFCHNNIKDFRKVIEITNAYVLCNDTTDKIIVRQINSIQKQKIILEPDANTVFNWSNKMTHKLICISILIEGQEWGYSVSLPIDKMIDTFIVRNKTKPANFKILSLQLQQTNNITFIHITNADHKYIISNDLHNATITLYQQALFDPKNQQYLPKNIQPSLFVYSVQQKQQKAFGYQLPLHSRRLNVHIELDPKHYECDCQIAFSLQNLQSNMVQKSVQIKKQNQTKIKISYVLMFDKKSRTLRFFIKRRQIFKKNQDLQVRLKLKSINIGLIGLHDQIRKQLINVCFSGIAYNVIVTNQNVDMTLQVANLRIQNTIRAQPYFISLLSQAQQKNSPAFVFVLKKSKQNPNLIYYIGFSMRKSTLTVTSEELQILQQNFNTILQKLNQKSDTNYQINIHEKFKPTKIRNCDKLYFVIAEIHPMKLIMTYKHVNNWGGALLKALSINQCKVKVDGKKVTQFESKDLLQFLGAIANHFKEGFQNQILSMIGSLALLGSPLNLASKIGCGLQNLITLPADGFEDDGVLGIGKGIAMGTGSLLSNTVEGAFGTVESITGTIGNGISGLAYYDQSYTKKRQQLKNERVQHVGQGLLSGGKSIVNGFFTGITGLVTEPIKGAEKSGIGGFFKGGLKGLTGLIVKPVSGVIDATSKTAEGIKNTTKVFSKQAKEQRTRKYDPRPFYGSFREIRTYDPIIAVLNKTISTFRSKYQNLSWYGYFQAKSGSIIVVTFEYVLFLNRQDLDVDKQFQSSSLQSVSTQDDKIVAIMRNQDNERVRVIIECKDTIGCYKELRNIYNYHCKNYQTGIINKTTPK